LKNSIIFKYLILKIQIKYGGGVGGEKRYNLLKLIKLIKLSNNFKNLLGFNDNGLMSNSDVYTFNYPSSSPVIKDNYASG